MQGSNPLKPIRPKAYNSAVHSHTTKDFFDLSPATPSQQPLTGTGCSSSSYVPSNQQQRLPHQQPLSQQQHHSTHLQHAQQQQQQQQQQQYLKLDHERSQYKQPQQQQQTMYSHQQQSMSTQPLPQGQTSRTPIDIPNLTQYREGSVASTGTVDMSQDCILSPVTSFSRSPSFTRQSSFSTSFNMDIINLEPNDATQVLDYGPNSRASGSFTPALTATPIYNSNDSTLSGSISSASSGSTSSAPKARQPSKKSALSTTSVQRNPTSSNRKRDHSATSAALVITADGDEGEADEASRNDNESEDQEGGSGSAAKFIWGEKEMQFLVDWWKVPYNYHKLKNPSDYRYQTTKQAIYKELASLMAKDDYAVTSKQIENKMFAMMAAYKEAKKILNKTGAGDKDGKTLSEQIEDVCSFFDAVHPVWDGDMNTDPINIRSTVSSERRGVGTGGHATGAVGSSVWDLDGLPQESSRPIREGTGAATKRAKPLDKAQNQNGLLDGIQKLGNRTNETYMKMEETKQLIAKEEARVQIEKVQLDKLEIQMRMARQEKDRVDDRQIQHHRSQQQKREHEVQILAQKAKAKLETEAEVTRRTALKLEIARERRQQEEMKLKNEQETLRLKIELKKLEMELLAKGKKDE